ncbi:MAG: helix-turn-helix transcriptional regulator [Caulobacterales bacterium]|nr:helix-turn-helix transcriptional regulator [Caulobacterales bacterium]
MLTRVSHCPIEGAMILLSGRWRALILYYLNQGPMRFNALRRANPGLSQQMLTRELRALETAGVITRTVYPEVPPRVEYALTAAGERLMPIIGQLSAWWASTQDHREADTRENAA